MLKKNNILILFLLVLLSACLSGATVKPKYNTLSFKTVNGKEIQLQKINGKIILVDFWATWCPPCRKTIPKLIDIEKNLGDYVTVLGISLDQKISLKELHSFYKANKINYPVGFANKSIYNYFGPVHAIPTIFIVSPKGEILDKVIGYDPRLDIKVKYYIKKLKLKKTEDKKND
ncbi:TlpA family protein disulfide reductase [bacterium]|nr:TlpA family protein disulfide reductase [bacterium]